MSDNNLTGTEGSRFNEIQDNWLTFEPVSNSKLENYNLYSVPIGQNFAASVIVESGSLDFMSGAIQIEKNIHIFEDEVEASKFINEIGQENVSSYIEEVILSVSGPPRKKIQIQLLNIPQMRFRMILNDCKLSRGFKVEVFSSSSLGLVEVEKETVYDADDNIINNSYLKYFEIKSDIQ